MITFAWKRAASYALSFLVAFAALSAAASAASIQVNKAFAPSSIALGATSTVTISLQNNSTLSAAAITAFKDDIGTMAGGANVAAAPALSTTCVGGTPSIAGNVVTMNNGTIPIAANASTPGICTISFNVQGAKLGNSFNTILAATLRRRCR